MNKMLDARLARSRSLRPRIEMFSPFNKPFTAEKEEVKDNVKITKFVIVSPKVEEYMIDDNTKIVAKCTPCQCCACR